MHDSPFKSLWATVIFTFGAVFVMALIFGASSGNALIAAILCTIFTLIINLIRKALSRVKGKDWNPSDGYTDAKPRLEYLDRVRKNGDAKGAKRKKVKKSIFGKKPDLTDYYRQQK